MIRNQFSTVVKLYFLQLSYMASEYWACWIMSYCCVTCLALLDKQTGDWKGIFVTFARGQRLQKSIFSVPFDWLCWGHDILIPEAVLPPDPLFKSPGTGPPIESKACCLLSKKMDWTNEALKICRGKHSKYGTNKRYLPMQDISKYSKKTGDWSARYLSSLSMN